jgi:hypothetical protein
MTVKQWRQRTAIVGIEAFPQAIPFNGPLDYFAYCAWLVRQSNPTHFRAQQQEKLGNLSTLVTRKCSESLPGCREDDQRVNHGVCASRTIFKTEELLLYLGSLH